MNRSQLQDRILTMVPDDEAERIMRWVDEYVTDLTEVPAETWTAAEVAVHINAAGAAAARSTLSRWGIEAVGRRPHPDSGRLQSLFPAEKVRKEYFDRYLKEAVI